MRGLYAIVDTAALDQLGIDIIRFSEVVLSVRPAAIQLRDKTSDRTGLRRTLELLSYIVPIAAGQGVPLYVNDRVDLALLTGCPGVHVGQTDLPVPSARRLAKKCNYELSVGLSNTNESQIRQGVEDGPDYLAIGPVFGTHSKVNPNPTLGIPRLRELTKYARHLGFSGPLVAIGGIDIETAEMVGEIVDAAAVIGGLLPSPTAGDMWRDVHDRAKALHEAIAGAEKKV
jgi:thiamine-phosphate pyrophosphorylase